MISLEKIKEIATANNTTIQSIASAMFMNLQKMNMLGENAQLVKIAATVYVRKLADTRTAEQKKIDAEVEKAKMDVYFASPEYRKELYAPARK